MNVRELLCDMGHESAIVFDGPDYDDAIVGVSHDGRVIYDYDAIPYAGPQAPIVMTRLTNEEDDV